VSFPDVTPCHRTVRARGVETTTRPAGLLEKLVAAVRPEFRAEILIFDPRDPVFGAPPCAVSGCLRPMRARQLCWGHHTRWRAQGQPDLIDFARSSSPQWGGHRRLSACLVADCRAGRGGGRGMCRRHATQWKREGCPDTEAWLRSSAPTPPLSPPPRTCLIGYCDLWARGDGPLCDSHQDRWRNAGRPDLDEYAASCEDPGPGTTERIDLRPLPPHLCLEVQYVLQSRRDEAQARIIPATAHRVVRLVARQAVTSFLDEPDDFWRRLCPRKNTTGDGRTAFLLDAHRRIEELAYGRGWDVEYPRPTWRLRNLGADQHNRASISFARIPQPWLTDLTKRWARWRLTIGQSSGYVASGVNAVARFARFIATAGIDALANVDRALLERYLADLHAQFANRRNHANHLGALAGFLTAIRQHHWDDTLPATAMFFSEDYPRRSPLLPRALAEHIMVQVENPANLDRWDNPAYRLISLILMRCGVRISSALRLPFDCVITDADNAGYLRYHNTKMKREALVPIDDELWQEIRNEQQRVLARWPSSPPLLLPRPSKNLDGAQPIRSDTYRQALHRWLQRCDVRDEHGRLVRLTPHQWRHTVGTRLINRDVPQEIVRRILDHDSAEMTAHYARLHDTTVRRHWERARKVNITGDTVALDPDGPLAEASWAKQRLSHATQALPNGYCGLPSVRSCPHANSCLTCPMFLTSAELLPQHRQHHRHTLRIISAAEASGQTRMAEMNRQVANNLEKIITALEADEDQQRATDAR